MSSGKLLAAEVPVPVHAPVHSAKRGRPPREAALHLGSHILDVAFDHFVLAGIERANMDMIAQAAGVTKRTLYARYGSKQGLLQAVLEHCLTSKLDPIVAGIPKSGTRARILHVARKLLIASLTPRAVGIERLLREIADHDRGVSITNSPLKAEPFIDVFHAILMGDPGARPEGWDDLRFLAAFLFDALITSPRVRIQDRKELSSDAASLNRFLERTLDIVAHDVPMLQATA